MDILDRIKRVINESIQPLFVKQEEDLGQLIRKDTQSAVSDLKYFVSQQAENNGRDMGNMLQLIYSLNQTVADLSKKNRRYAKGHSPVERTSKGLVASGKHCAYPSFHTPNLLRKNGGFNESSGL